MSLIECKGLWGEAHLMYGDPPSRTVENGIYIPYRNDGPWGIFDESRKIVMEGVDLRGASRTPKQNHLDWQDVDTLEQDPASVTYLYCGWFNPHYGHFLVNSLPRLWPFLAETPDVKLLLASPLAGYPNFIHEILGRLGIDTSSVASFDKPTIVRKVLIPAPSMLEQHWIYTNYRDLCEKISRGLWTDDEVDSVDTPVYLSKSQLTNAVGKFQDETVIEEIVSSAGIDIVYPEQLDFSAQVRLFATRKLLIGSLGSAFHTAIFAPPGRNTICYANGSDINSNFAMIDKLCDTRSAYYYQEGMRYDSSREVMTIVRLADARELGENLVGLARQRVSWSSKSVERVPNAPLTLNTPASMSSVIPGPARRQTGHDQARDTNFKIYIATHRRRVEELSDPGYVPIHCGKSRTTEEFANIGDDVGDNISQLNPYFNENTALYWMAKNEAGKADYMGLAHYRRYFVAERSSTVIEGHAVASSNDFLSLTTGEIDMFVAEPIGFVNPKTDTQYSLEQNYFGAHVGFDLYIAREAVEMTAKEYLGAFDFAMRNCQLVAFNLFVGRRRVVEEYAEWLFPILFLLNDWVPYKSYATPYQQRAIAFLSERLFTVWIVKNRRRLKFGFRPVLFCENL